jgi:hypothetical protein
MSIDATHAGGHIDVIVQPHHRIMRARIGKAVFQVARYYTAAGRNKKPADGVCGLLPSLLADGWTSRQREFTTFCSSQS